MPNEESPFSIVMTKHDNDNRTYDYILLKNGNPVNPEHYTVKWTFGDEATSNSISGTHTFGASGSFTINCEVKSTTDPKPDGDPPGSSSPPPPPPIILEVD